MIYLCKTFASNSIILKYCFYLKCNAVVIQEDFCSFKSYSLPKTIISIIMKSKSMTKIPQQIPLPNLMHPYELKY